MITRVTGFVLMTTAALFTVAQDGNAAVVPAAVSFLAGMYFGTLIGNKEEEDEKEVE